MVIIKRNQLDPHQTRGRLTVVDDDYMTALFMCNTLELPWQDNATNISCIPDGLYKATKWTSPTFGVCIRLYDVPNRSHILIHTGNYASLEKTDSQGCILVGNGYSDINGDGILDIINSRKTMDKLLDIVPHSFDIDIQTIHLME